jgi:hypothetical protein
MALFIAKINSEFGYVKKWLWLNFMSEGVDGR